MKKIIWRASLLGCIIGISLFGLLSIATAKATTKAETSYALSFDYAIGMEDKERAADYTAASATVKEQSETYIYGTALQIQYTKAYGSVSRKFSVTAGKTYEFSFWINTEGVTSGTVYTQYTVDGKYLQIYPMLGQDWTKYSATFTATSDKEETVYFTSTAKGTVYLDEVYIRQSFETVTVKEGEVVGELPVIPEKEGHAGVWTVDGKSISADTVWQYTEDKTALLTYYLKKEIMVSVDGFTETLTVYGDAYTMKSEELESLLKKNSETENKTLLAYTVTVNGESTKKHVGEVCVLDMSKEYTVALETVDFYTLEGASVRTQSPTGIRFETRIGLAAYNTLLANYDEVSTGTYILPYKYLKGETLRSYLTSADTVAGKDYVDIENNGFYNMNTAETDGYYRFYCSLVNIRSHNYTTDFIGVGYIRLVQGDTEILLLGGDGGLEDSRNIYYVAKEAYAVV